MSLKIKVLDLSLAAKLNIIGIGFAETGVTHYGKKIYELSLRFERGLLPRVHGFNRYHPDVMPTPHAIQFALQSEAGFHFLPLEIEGADLAEIGCSFCASAVNDEGILVTVVTPYAESNDEQTPKDFVWTDLKVA